MGSWQVRRFHPYFGRLCGAGEDAVEPGSHPKYVILKRVYVPIATERAVLVQHDGEEFWLPRSVLADDGVARGYGGDLEVLERFLRDEEII